MTHPGRLLVAAALLGACGGTTEPRAAGAPDLPVALITTPVDDARQAQLVLVSADGRTTRTLATFAGPKAAVRWSPDGTRLAFTGAATGVAASDPASAVDLWVVNADGTGLEQLTTDRATLQFGWLPDGRLFRLQADGTLRPPWTLVPAGAAGAPPVTTYPAGASPGGAVRDLTVSPDGARATFTLDFGDSSAVYVAAFDGTAARQVAMYAGAPRWSPTGDRVAYAQQVGSGVGIWDIGVARADGTGTPVRFATGSSPAFEPSNLTWSPDGARFAWVTVLQGSQRLRAYTALADGSGAVTPVVARPASATDNDLSVDWRPTATP